MKKLKVSNSVKKKNFQSKSYNVTEVSESSFEEVFSDRVDAAGGTSTKGKRMRDGWMGGRLRQQMSLNIPQSNIKVCEIGFKMVLCWGYVLIGWCVEDFSETT